MQTEAHGLDSLVAEVAAVAAAAVAAVAVVVVVAAAGEVQFSSWGYWSCLKDGPEVADAAFELQADASSLVEM